MVSARAPMPTGTSGSGAHAPRMVLVGGCHRDVIARTSGRFEPGTSCPGEVLERPGGVARNVAVLVASAGINAALLSRVGADAAGRRLMDGLAAAGVDASAVIVDDEDATGSYVAVHDDAGELVAAVSDMAIYGRLTPATLAASTDLLDKATMVFADANIPGETLTWLAGRIGERLAVDAVSRAKAGRMLAALRLGALGFINLPSAGAIVGDALPSPAAAADALACLGVRRAVVTGGRAPVAVLEDGRVETRDVPPVAVVDVTGAGDALTAGTLVALTAGLPLAEAVGSGIAAAGAAVGSTGALDRLPPTVLQALGSISGETP